MLLFEAEIRHGWILPCLFIYGRQKTAKSYLLGSTPLRMMSRKSDMMSLSWTSSSTTWLTEDNNLWNIRLTKRTIKLVKSGTAVEKDICTGNIINQCNNSAFGQPRPKTNLRNLLNIILQIWLAICCYVFASIVTNHAVTFLWLVQSVFAQAHAWDACCHPFDYFWHKTSAFNLSRTCFVHPKISFSLVVFEYRIRSLFNQIGKYIVFALNMTCIPWISSRTDRR